MSKVAIVTDSTAYLPPEIVEKYQITVIPQVLIWGEETLLDGIDIQPTEFYERLKTADVMPTTSQATVLTFKELFERLLGDGKEILCVLLSDKLSGTINSYTQAIEYFPDAKIDIVNTESVAMALGFCALEAARLAQTGTSLEECKAAAESAKERVGVVFAVDTLEFLHRGGRIGGASRFLGTALQLKPILTVLDGRVEAIERVRTKRKAHNRLLELIEERTAGSTSIKLATLHASAYDDAKALLDEAVERLGNVDESIFSELSPVVGTHAGPGTVGLAYMVTK
ncbi:MAG: DegV family protein [Anaerolineales bacterium]|nr:DegV family protein [Chloroflexota bacterium]MBL6980293.1 DegV family protein [Anaerolineales bacterium]